MVHRARHLITPFFNAELDEWGEKEIVHDNTTLLLFCAIVSAETGPIRVGTASLLSYYSGDTEQFLNPSGFLFRVHRAHRV